MAGYENDQDTGYEYTPSFQEYIESNPGAYRRLLPNESSQPRDIHFFGGDDNNTGNITIASYRSTTDEQSPSTYDESSADEAFRLEAERKNQQLRGGIGLMAVAGSVTLGYVAEKLFHFSEMGESGAGIFSFIALGALGHAIYRRFRHPVTPV